MLEQYSEQHCRCTDCSPESTVLVLPFQTDKIRIFLHSLKFQWLTLVLLYAEEFFFET